MRILLCLNRDLVSNTALNRLWPALAGHTCDIVLSEGIGRPGEPRAPGIVAWGDAERRAEGAVLRSLEALQYTAPGRFRTFGELASETWSREPKTFPSINRGDGLDYLRAFAPDVIVSVRFGQIFKPAAIAVPPLGVLNLHSGVLPDYRGVLATFWALLEGEERIGCTLHHVTDGTIDTGDIIAIHRRPADRSRSVLWNVLGLYDGGCALVADALATLAANGSLPRTQQPTGNGRYFTYPGQAEIDALAATGIPLFSPSDFADLVALYGAYDQALSPLWPRTFPGHS